MRRNEVWVGAVILLSVVVAVAGSFWLRGYRLTGGTTTVEALFSGVGQLTDGASVKLRGVTIGRVNGIAVEPDGAAVRIGLAINAGLQLPADAAVLIAPESMFGDWGAEIVSRSAHPRLDFFQPADPEVLPGFAIADLSRLTATADQIAENLATITDRVEVAFTEETAANLRIVIENVGRVSEQVAELADAQIGAVEDLVENVRTSTNEVAQAAALATSTLGEVERLLSGGVVDSIVGDTRVTASEFRQLATDLRETTTGLATTLQFADSTLVRFERIGRELEAGEGTLAQLLADSTVAVQTQSVLMQLSLLLEDFRENPGRYVRLSIF
ncbi:MAG: MlaD family protein [Gammaproteobacteria bacterium]|nr:MlaD family protein [Gammaproteobacteria bacterium]